MKARSFLTAILLVAASGSGFEAHAGNDHAPPEVVALMRQLFDGVMTKGQYELYNRIHSPDFVAHGGTRSFTREQDLESAKGWRQAFPDGVMTIDQLLVDGAYVTVRFTGRGTNRGSGNGLPATGKRVEVGGITIFHLANGVIAEEWTVIDELGLMRQLGLTH